MSQSAAGAVALLLLWLAFACFFIAFHPGGIEVNGHPARNPRDVILWFMQRVSHGADTGSGTVTVSETQPSNGTQTV